MITLVVSGCRVGTNTRLAGGIGGKRWCWMVTLIVTRWVLAIDEIQRIRVRMVVIGEGSTVHRDTVRTLGGTPRTQLVIRWRDTIRLDSAERAPGGR